MDNIAPAWLRLLFAAAGRIAPRRAARRAVELLSDPGGRNPPQPWESGQGPEPREVELRPGLFAQAWGAAGPLVLAVHGWRGRPRQFQPLATALLQRGHQVVALDLPGHGRSAGRTITPDGIGRLVAGVAAELRPVAVVGHSFGGACLGPATLHGLAAGRIVIIASPSRLSRMRRAHARGLGLPPRALAEAERLMDTEAGRPVRELDLVATLPCCAAAGLVVHDRDDAVIPFAAGEALAAAWPAARFLATATLGHRELLADAAVIAAVTEFVTGPGV